MCVYSVLALKRECSILISVEVDVVCIGVDVGVLLDIGVGVCVFCIIVDTGVVYYVHSSCVFCARKLK